MVGMAQKPRTRNDRILSLCAWALVLLIDVVLVLRSHDARFLDILVIAIALMMMLREVKGLMEEPN
jgi:hypothetical protein